MAKSNNLGRAFKRAFHGFDANNLDFSQAGSWPVGPKVIVVVLIFVLTLAAGYFLVLSDLDDQYDAMVREEPRLKEQVTKKSEMVVGLPMYKARLEEIEARFKVLLQQLPLKQEVPGLLDQMTKLGQNAGLTFRQIDLQPEQKSSFYQILPIKITVFGAYHAIGEFIYGLAALPRVVTLHDFDLTPQADGSLQLVLQARTYRFEEEDEQAASKPANGSNTSKKAAKP
ncbi:type 4a pilus biogenesis protein PilO [Pokkaliibacter sp. MBI-7]|uniref:type 4a pilus biogenesis protein PilO n=1 Tax=Pokkaliibacter sp. MBI-7 TaxID=3040600 RepID=UPI00244D4340|nr:type 4a pilus biogenesis protein PilO [Pokkaliibacter sp. MBI-7]MDH2433612.1 type 4a pilus biogenesis protein PilO [Pokkaliibacter sp. MBI-7]